MLKAPDSFTDIAGLIAHHELQASHVAYPMVQWSKEDNIITSNVAQNVAELAPNQLRINPAQFPAPRTVPKSWWKNFN